MENKFEGGTPPQESKEKKEREIVRGGLDFKKEWGCNENPYGCPRCGSPNGNFNSFENYCYECSWDGEHPGDREEVGLEPLKEKSFVSLSTFERMKKEAEEGKK